MPVVAQNSYTANFAYTQGFQWGTSITAGFNNTHVTSNNPTTLLTPELSSNFQFKITQNLLQGFGSLPNFMLSKLSRGIVPAVLAIVLVAAVAHVASSSSGAMNGPMGHHGFHGMHGGMDALGMPLPLLLKTANLTDAQKQQIHTIFENRRAARKAEYQQLHAAREAIAAKFTSTGTVAASDLSSPVATMTQIHDQMMNEQIQDAIAIRNVLTPAQLAQISATKAKLDSIHAEMKALWAQGGGPSASTPTE